MKKKVDVRVRDLLDRCTQNNHRGFFIVIGDNARAQTVTLHYLLSKSIIGSAANNDKNNNSNYKNKKVLWCYKNALHLSSHRKKRLKQVKKMISRGILDKESAAEDPFSLFIASTPITYCYYHETQKGKYHV